MKKMMYLVVLVSSIMSGIYVSDSSAVSKYVGMQSECTGCPVPFLTTLTVMCDGATNCPRFFAPDRTDATGQTWYGTSDAFNPPRCVKSVDETATWSACAANPFASVTTSQTSFAVARNGTLLAANSTASGTCQISRSTNGGVSWGIVFTSATQISCGNTSGATTSLLNCDSDSDYCSLLGFDQSTFVDIDPVDSTDNGANWGIGAKIIVGGNNGGQPVANWGVGGMSGGVGITGGTARSTGFAIIRSGNTWTKNLLSNFGADATGNGCAALVVGGTARMLCTPISTAVTTFTLRDITGTVLGSNSPIGAPPRTGGPTPLAMSTNSTTLYVIMLNALVANTYRVWLSTDNFVSSIVVGDFTVSAGGTICCRGSAWYYNGKIYFGDGASGGSAAHIMRLS